MYCILWYYLALVNKFVSLNYDESSSGPLAHVRYNHGTVCHSNISRIYNRILND